MRGIITQELGRIADELQHVCTRAKEASLEDVDGLNYPYMFGVATEVARSCADRLRYVQKEIEKLTQKS